MILKLTLAICGILISGVSRSQPQKPITTHSQSETTQLTFSDQSQSKIQIYKDSSVADGITGWRYKSTEVNYQVLSFAGNPFGNFFSSVPFEKNEMEYYIAKTSMTVVASQGSESSDKTFTVEIRPLKAPKHAPFIIKQNCDNLSFESDYFKTVKYGCCGGDDQLAFYDLQNKLIIKGDREIVVANIPNSKIKFYVAYKDSYPDTAFLGTLFFSYGHLENYQVKIKPTAALPSKCEYRIPDIFIASTNPKDTARVNNEYQLWSFNELKNKDDINNMSLKVVFECTTEDKLDTVEIPIINGKPFGKDEKIQEYSYRKK